MERERRIELALGGWLRLFDPFLDEAEAGRVFDALLREVPFRQESIRLFGKSILQPRLTAWHGEPGAAYTYSGLALSPLPLAPCLVLLRARVEEAAGSSFNSVLVNHYRGGEDSMGKHADDEPELGKNPVIASLSLGEKRGFVIEPKKKADGPRLSFELGGGNLLVMGGTTQHHYRHGVPKQPGRGARINLTFRRILR